MSVKNKFLPRFYKNFRWLFLLNSLGYFFSFLTLPILISKFGLKELGIALTIQVIMVAIATIANYSFVYYVPTASKLISNDNREFSTLWSLSLTIRSIFSIFFGLLSTIIVFIYFDEHLFLWLLSFPILLAKIVSPTLFCNALEKNNYIFKIGFFTKLLFFLFIYFSNTIAYVNFFFGLSELIIVLFFLRKISANFLDIKFVGVKKIVLFLKQTFSLFLVNFFSHLKTTLILPVIVYLIGSEYATLYTLSEKGINVIRSVSGSMFVSFFPIYNKETVAFKFLSFKNLCLIIVLSVIIIGVLYVLSPFFIFYLNNFTSNILATRTLRILALSIPMFFLIIPLFSYLLEHKKWNAILLFAIIQLIVLVGLVFMFHQDIIQIAINFVLSEYTMLLCYYLYVLWLENRKAIVSI